MKNLFQKSLFLLLFIALFSCNDLNSRIIPSDDLKGLSSETISELNQLKGTLGPQIAYKALSLEHKDTKSVARLLVVAMSEEALEQAIEEKNITFLVNSFETSEGSSSDNSKQKDLKDVEAEPIATVYYIFDDVTSEVEIKTYGLRFFTDY